MKLYNQTNLMSFLTSEQKQMVKMEHHRFLLKLLQEMFKYPPIFTAISLFIFLQRKSFSSFILRSSDLIMWKIPLTVSDKIRPWNLDWSQEISRLSNLRHSTETGLGINVKWWCWVIQRNYLHFSSDSAAARQAVQYVKEGNCK